MRLIILAALGASLSGCMLNPDSARPDPGYPTSRSSEMKDIDPYHRDKIPDTPYEIRKAEMERDEKLAGKGGDSYPPLFKGHAKTDGQP